MAFGSFNEPGSGQQPMSEINVTPLVDVMLVLVIIFHHHRAAADHGIKIDLPKASSTANPEKPETVTLSLDAKGKVYWNDKAVSDEQLPAMMAEAAKKQPQPELHLACRPRDALPEAGRDHVDRAKCRADEARVRDRSFGRRAGPVAAGARAGPPVPCAHCCF